MNSDSTDVKGQRKDPPQNRRKTGVRQPIPSAGKGSRIVNGILALLWLWMGVVYHLTFFRATYPATLFGMLFIVQAACSHGLACGERISLSVLGSIGPA